MSCRKWSIRPWATTLLMGALMGTSYAGSNDTQVAFETPEKALAALAVASKALDTNTLNTYFGPTMAEIANPDPIQRANNLRRFSQYLDEFSGLATQDNGQVVIQVGNEHWPFPIPLVQRDGQWRFDTPAGKEEILNRRIGRNELSAIEVCHSYIQAQREYAAKDCAGKGTMEYAQHMCSTPGMTDGLYWETRPGEDPSPFGPLVGAAQEEGYYQQTKPNPGVPRQRKPFHGYLFRILTKQGPEAPGGKHDFIINGHMVAGFGLLAYPVEWGNSGVMTFIVNQQGKVFQKNLGEKTTELAPAIDEYNPDTTWHPAE